jgi:hypothetical protein
MDISVKEEIQIMLIHVGINVEMGTDLVDQQQKCHMVFVMMETMLEEMDVVLFVWWKMIVHALEEELGVRMCVLRYVGMV